MEYHFRERSPQSTKCHQYAAGIGVLALTLLGFVLSSVVSQVCFTPPKQIKLHTHDAIVLGVPGLYVGQCWWYGVSAFLIFSYYVIGFGLFRSFPVASLQIFTVVVLAVVPVVIVRPLSSVFQFLKLFSVSGALIIMQSFRVTNMFRHMEFEKSGYWDPAQESTFAARNAKFVARLLRPEHFESELWKWFLFCALVINITEAVVFDFLDGSIANPLVGIFCILSMPRPYFTTENRKLERRVFFFTHLQPSFKSVAYVDNSKRFGYYDLVYETDWWWVLVYSSWDAVFAYREETFHFYAVCIVLVAGLFSRVGWRDPLDSFRMDPHLYLQARTCTLGLRYIIFAYYDIYLEFIDASDWYNEDARFWWGIGNAIFCIFVVIGKAATFTGKHSRTSMDREIYADAPISEDSAVVTAEGGVSKNAVVASAAYMQEDA